VIGGVKTLLCFLYFFYWVWKSLTVDIISNGTISRWVVIVFLFVYWCCSYLVFELCNVTSNCLSKSYLLL